MFKRAVALVVTAAMALGLAACNTETTEATASIYTKVTESMMSLNEDGVKAVNATRN